MYANSAYLIRKPSQSDFEQRIRNILIKKSVLANSIDWHLLEGELKKVIPEKNLTVLPYEKMNEFLVWKRFADVLGLNAEETFRKTKNKSINVKRINKNSEWVGSDKFQILADMKIFEKIRPFASKIFNHRIRQKLFSKIGLGQVSIVMPDELREKVDFFFGVDSEK